MLAFIVIRVTWLCCEANHNRKVKRKDKSIETADTAPLSPSTVVNAFQFQSSVNSAAVFDTPRAVYTSVFLQK